MSKKEKQVMKRKSEEDGRPPLAKMTRLLEILVRLELQNMKGERSQNQMISMLDMVGCGQSEIAELLGTTTNTVNASLYKAKKKARK